MFSRDYDGKLSKHTQSNNLLGPLASRGGENVRDPAAAIYRGNPAYSPLVSAVFNICTALMGAGDRCTSNRAPLHGFIVIVSRVGQRFSHQWFPPSCPPALITPGMATVRGHPESVKGWRQGLVTAGTDVGILTGFDRAVYRYLYFSIHGTTRNILYTEKSSRLFFPIL